MIERVVENWLDNVSERGYETAFCQMLVADGHAIIRRPAHGPTEHGKDVVTRDRKGKLHAYQLKTGNIGKFEWRQIIAEVKELVEVPIQEPGISTRARFIPHLVTTGQIKEPVKDEIRLRNVEWQQRYGRELDLIYKDSLLRMFIDLQGNFLPTEPADFEKFLRLYLGEKQGPLKKDEFAKFLDSLSNDGLLLKASQMRKGLAAAAVFASFVLSGHQSAENYFAVAEGWMLVIAHLLKVAESKAAVPALWQSSLNLCVEAWESMVGSLVREALASPNWIEGDIATDRVIHGHRKTILLGYLACFALYRRMIGKMLPEEDEIYQRISSELRFLTFWGESASPFLMAAILFLWVRGSEGEAVQLGANLIKLIAEGNRKGAGVGLPDPYEDSPTVLQEAIRRDRENQIVQFVSRENLRAGGQHPPVFYQTLAGLVQGVFPKSAWNYRQTFTGRSFSIRSFVEFLVRRERKAVLKRLWYDITQIDYAEFEPKTASDFYLWRVKKGSLVTRCFGRPTAWATLFEEATSPVRGGLLLFARFPQLLLPFALVYPHRMTPALVRRCEQRVKSLM